MAAHKLRTGALRVCFTCKSADAGHAATVCMTSDPVIAEVVACHCPCQPACTRHACQPENIKTGRRRQPPLCPSCRLTHARECL